jgi:1-deoxy-D-xylulose-5-phosphate reductoisomerase
MRDIVILGSTGSIGVQALEIVDANPTLFRVVALTSTGKNPSVVIEQAKKYKVSVVGVIINADVIRQALPNISVIDDLIVAKAHMSSNPSTNKFNYIGKSKTIK